MDVRVGDARVVQHAAAPRNEGIGGLGLRVQKVVAGCRESAVNFRQQAPQRVWSGTSSTMPRRSGGHADSSRLVLATSGKRRD